MRRLLPLPAVVLAILGTAAAPASAVVGGERVPAARVPWFVGTGICGGTLIAPDRIATAAHCVDPVDMSDLSRIAVGDETRKGIRVALPSTWRAQRVGFAVDDVAVVQLDRPVTTVRPAAVATPGSATPRRLVIVGRGQIAAPDPGRTALPGLFPLRRATLRTVGDAACGRLWRRSGTKYRTRFQGPSDVCATDADGGPPRDSVCAGDSGGPMVGGTLARPVLFAVISWTGPRCGADGLPSVGADARHFHDFLTNPAPTWAPVAAGALQIMGDARVGAQLTCALPAFEQPAETVQVRWLRRTTGAGGRYRFTRVGTGDIYTPVAADAGRLLQCEALATNAGGRTLVPIAPESAVRVAG